MIMRNSLMKDIPRAILIRHSLESLPDPIEKKPHPELDRSTPHTNIDYIFLRYP